MHSPHDTNARILHTVVEQFVTQTISYSTYLINKTLHSPTVVRENGSRVIYVVVLQAIYGMLIASLLFHKKLRGDLEKVFPHNIVLVAWVKLNKVVNQQTSYFHNS